jgi:GT2 family glycosyltransferase
MDGLPFALLVHRMPENGGNAGGVGEAMDLAFAKGADAVWILDDDSFPRPGALEALVQPPWNERIVRHALQVDPKTGRFTWPMWVGTENGWRLVFDESELPPTDSVPSRASWTGALLPGFIYQAVGPVNAALFIRGEDEEYPWRIGQAGFSFEAIRCAVMDHSGPDDLLHWRFAGKNFFLERKLSDWKLYYKVRNMVWLKRRQNGLPGAVITALAYGGAVAVCDGPLRVPLIIEAVRDGLAGRLGRWRKHPA